MTKPTAKAVGSVGPPPVGKAPDSKPGACPIGQWRDPFAKWTKL